MITKSYSRKEIRKAYRISTGTFNQWLKSIADKLNLKRRQKVFTPKQVQTIIDQFGPFENTEEQLRLF